LGKLLKMEMGLSFEQSLLRYDGRPITRDQLIEYI